jgi:hypothetical protein
MQRVTVVWMPTRSVVFEGCSTQCFIAEPATRTKAATRPRIDGGFPHAYETPLSCTQPRQDACVFLVR